MASETWITVREGKLIYHIENDGYRFLRRGLEETDEIVTLEELKNNPKLYAEALKKQDCVKNNKTCEGCKDTCPA